MAQDKAIVAAVRTTPETVIEDYARVMELAGYKEALDPTKQTILKNNISWHLLYPSANSTPWQVEGVAKTLKEGGYDDLVGELKSGSLMSEVLRTENRILKEQVVKLKRSI